MHEIKKRIKFMSGIFYLKIPDKNFIFKMLLGFFQEQAGKAIKIHESKILMSHFVAPTWNIVFCTFISRQNLHDFP